jgi:hypothetical protein
LLVPLKIVDAFVKRAVAHEGRIQDAGYRGQGI